MTIELPHILREHSLFADPVRYPEPENDLTAAHIDAKLRRKYHMPSTGDETESNVLDALENIYQNIRQRIDSAPCMPSEVSEQAMSRQRLTRLINAFENGSPGPLEVRMLDRLCPKLIQHGIMDSPPDRDISINDLIILLHQSELLLLDQIARTHPEWKEQYHQTVFNAIDEALAYNSTADTIRIKPVISWIRENLDTRGIQNANYADVGCSVKTGAKNTLIAADYLRPSNASTLHGIDIVEPDEALVLSMQGQHKIHLYQHNTIGSPLPHTYDVILLANVHRHLTREDQLVLFSNLACSLSNNGLIFINWRFDQQRSPCILLQRQSNSLVPRAEKNCL